jgi:hypothetical protein
MSKYKLYICLLGVIVFSLLIRTLYIEKIPSNLNPDASDTLQTYLQHKYQSPSQLVGLNWNGAPILNAEIIGLSWEIFGKSIFGFRFASIIFSTSALGLLFIILYLLSEKIIESGLISLALATNPWFLNFSREPWENIFNTVYIEFIVLGWILYRRFPISGILLMTAGSVLGFYGYHPGKLFIIPIILFFLFNAITQRDKSKYIIHLFLILFLFTILIFPQLFYILSHRDAAFNRISAVSIFNTKDSLSIFMHNVISNIKGFIFFIPSSFNQGFLNTRYLPISYGPINLLLIIPFLLGLISSIKKYFFLNILYLVLLFPAQLFSLGTPDAARAIHIIPLIYIFIFFGFLYIQRMIFKRHHMLFLCVIAVIVSHVMVEDLYTYFNWITDSHTLDARQPAVDVAEFPSWYTKQENLIKKGRWGFTVGEWNTFSQEEKHSL